MSVQKQDGVCKVKEDKFLIAEMHRVCRGTLLRALTSESHAEVVEEGH